MSTMNRAYGRANEIQRKRDESEATRLVAITNRIVAEFNAMPSMEGMPDAQYVGEETFIGAGDNGTHIKTVRVLTVDDVTIGIYGGEPSPRFFLKTWCACGAPAWAAAPLERWRTEPFIDLVAKALLNDAVCYECQIEALGKTICRECGRAK